MLLLQILAGKMAGIDRILFYTVTNDCQQAIHTAEIYLNKLLNPGEREVSMGELINRIVGFGFQWGMSNGT